MEFRSIVLHLGAHKTGTSLVQKYLRDRGEACFKAGIFPMPRGDGDKLIGWGAAATLKAGAGTLRRNIETTARDGMPYFVLSHENSLGGPLRKDGVGLYPEAAARGAALKQALPDRPQRVIYYIRNQASFIESYYLQTIHQGKWHDFKEFMADVDLDRLSWVPLYETLCQLFGTENVVIRSFDADIAEGQSAYLRNFLSAATAADLTPFGDFDYNPVRNPSIGDRGLELARHINPVLQGPERKLFRRFLQDKFSNQDYPRPKLLTTEDKAALEARYAEENRALLIRSAETARPPL
ncbi:hypothetical protein T8T21_20650 (plasmid) [Limimaricola variabilis]|uniref:hypothetical protein n=1 Tax=Limimaricola variabilis TaxID=1492771 RepID=UPI002AC8C925|nr:hypothetical protein [Limimaricola variabilis]WPY97054.1 hypothetical protein T8T21_20650 [Limimaricola variabilis]